MKIDLNTEELRVVSEALNHVWREVFDKDTSGDGRHLAAVLARISGRS